MEEQYSPPQQSKYGNVSMRQQLADGVYMIAANALVKVVMVAQKLADRLLSAPARERGEPEGDYLSFPDEKASIPLYELAQMGKIRLFDEQVRRHFSNLTKLFPDYLRERGIISEKPAESLSEKVLREFEKYQKNLETMGTREVVKNAREIAERQELVEYLCKAEISRDGLGLLLAQENLLDAVYNKMEAVNRPLTRDNVAEAVTALKGELSRKPETVSKRLEAFKRELQVAKAVNAEAVELNMQTPEGAFKFAMNLETFKATVDPDMLARFAETAMLDFPDPHFYGDGNSELWKALVEKRFFSNLTDHFNQYANQGGNGYSLTVEKTLKKMLPENEFDGFINRARMAQYIAGNTDSPDVCLKELKGYFKDRAALIRDVQSLMADKEAEPAEAVLEVEQGEEAEV
ncbi:MAG: DUF3848 domain-containing protein [Oscillospiraceae bacterium]|jgi:hypothetical protein|nr:DUF3848 domain-containing protein [Oscillospiraceae bacterium]